MKQKPLSNKRNTDPIPPRYAMLVEGEGLRDPRMSHWKDGFRAPLRRRAFCLFYVPTRWSEHENRCTQSNANCFISTLTPTLFAGVSPKIQTLHTKSTSSEKK